MDWGEIMDKNRGSFSANLVSLELQVKTLLEGTGGSHAIALLDALSHLSGLEQEVALAAFTRVIERIASSGERIMSKDDHLLKEFEENLYREILDAMREAATNSRTRLEVVNGGKQLSLPKKPINLAEARKNRVLRRRFGRIN